MNRVRLGWAAVCLVTALVTGCGASSSSESQADTATAAATVTIAGMNYGAPVTVPPGAQIAVNNSDSVEHSVTSDTAGQFSVDVDGNEHGTFAAPAQPGEYAFHCKYHPSMHGTLIVK